MARLGVQRDTLARMLHSHGEDDLAERAGSITDDELARIGRLGAYYAFSEDALALGGRWAAPELYLWRRSTCSKAPDATCVDTTPTGSLPGDCQRSRTRASAPETVSYGFTLRTGSCPVRRARREETVADSGGS